MIEKPNEKSTVSTWIDFAEQEGVELSGPEKKLKKSELIGLIEARWLHNLEAPKVNVEPESLFNEVTTSPFPIGLGTVMGRNMNRYAVKKK